MLLCKTPPHRIPIPNENPYFFMYWNYNELFIVADFWNTKYS